MGVPARYIKDAPVDWDGEIWAAAGLPLEVGRVEVAQPSIGVWTLLEVADCDFYHPKKDPTVFGAYLAFYIMAQRKEAAKPLRSWVERGRRDDPEAVRGLDPFEADVVKFAKKHGVDEFHFLEMSRMLRLSLSGYSMIPSTEDGTGGLYIYGLDSLAAVVAGMGDVMQVPWSDLIWNTPMAVVGHVAAQRSRANGKKGVARPKDMEDMKLQFKLEHERNERGDLHPWEEKEPLRYGARPNMSTASHHRLAELQYAARAELEEKRRARWEADNA